ncbi:MAG: fasciclin domain-containing protein [Verrucomicrobiae bacterium]|nr:fasciclin domain-containing protein [Verrucomicrobiae bacterium]NNJ44035.1 fasciclin domain-containing protein [Akkermansiaceae bacterium]
MNNTIKLACAALLTCTLTTSATYAGKCASTCAESKLKVATTAGDASQQSVVAIAAGNKNFSTLVAAVKAAGLVDALNGDGPFTIFAPTNEAFAKLPAGTVESLLKPENKDKLVEILTYHVVAGKVDGATAVTLEEATALNKQKLKIQFRDAALYVNSSKVVATDIAASNGVIHVVDQVILPQQMSPATPDSRCRMIMMNAIEVGVRMFNSGHVTECSKIYEMAVLAVAEIKPNQLSKDQLSMLNDALTTVSKEKSARKNAWTLRHAMDAALVSFE